MSPGRARSSALSPALLVALLAFAVYLPSLFPGELLTFEDDHYVPGSAAVCNGRVGQMLNPLASREDLGGEYLPVRDLTYALDAQLWGTRTPPGSALDLDLTTKTAARGFRFTNLILYALACALACTFLHELTGDPLLAFLAGALFAVHPVHAENAAWVSGRKDVLSGALGFGALLLYVRARRMRAADFKVTYVTSVVLGLLAMLSKSTLVALPLLVALVELAGPLVRRERARITGFEPENERLDRARPDSLVSRALLVLPYVVVTLAVGWNARIVGRATGIERPPQPGGLTTILATDAPILVRYVSASFAPWDLRVVYGRFPFRTELFAPFHDPVVFKSLLVLFVIAGLVALAAWRRPRVVAFAAAWMLLALAPVLNFVPFVQVIADRYLFLPVLGPCLVVAWALVRARHFRATPAIGALLLLGLAALGVDRGLDFATSEGLFRSNLALEPDNALAHHQLGRAVLARAQKATAAHDPDAATFAAHAASEETIAIALYKRPEVLWAGHLEEARHSLALAYELEGKRVEAVQLERETLADALLEAERKPETSAREHHAAREKLGRFAARLLARAHEPADAPLAIEAARGFAVLGAPARSLARQALQRARELDSHALDAALSTAPELRELAKSP